MTTTYQPWPALNYEQFKSTGYLLHRATQIIGKLKLHTPFEPHWSNVILLLTARGLTSGLIPYNGLYFSIEIDLIQHRVSVITSNGLVDSFELFSMSVADFYHQLFSVLKNFNIIMLINLMPIEVPSPIQFTEDLELKNYDKNLANAWWRIMLSTYKVMLQYHAKFDGETPPIGLMWGTFDLRDARYNGISVKPSGINTDFIRRNAMDEGQIETGWWPGNNIYPKPAFYSFTYPQPQEIEQQKVEPRAAHWDNNLSEFILDYEDIQNSKTPEQDLLHFFESTYKAGANCAKWRNYLTQDKPN